MIDDPDFIARIQQRDAQAWSRLVDELIGPTFAFICHLVHGNRTVAEELNQDVWASAIDRIASFDAKRGDLRRWVFAIARNRVALHYRRRRNQQPLEDTTVGPLMDEGLLPEDVAHEIEQATAIKSALLCLSADEQRVLAEKYWQGKEINDIARQLDRTPKAVEGLLARARARLRELLKPFGCLNEERRDSDELARR